MRVKTGIVRHQHHKKVLKAAKGFLMARRRQYQAAKENVLHAGAYAYHGRKLTKRNFRRLWIQRIGAALTGTALNYSRFIKALKTKKIDLDRKILADLAATDSKTFSFILGQINERKTSKS